uniref:Uncharacterized protein n=1 Tax=Eutreptiella gymnastica TaxID=73025 RepID=A0A7S1NBD9_9EUGL|mmetsp:Transcript_149755/g.261671  ORF Transcript_149755/g.261671 Transcript_149755/m.261671 type:complete len:155 (+) Transcript_149755:28-492(+)
MFVGDMLGQTPPQKCECTSCKWCPYFDWHLIICGGVYLHHSSDGVVKDLWKPPCWKSDVCRLHACAIPSTKLSAFVSVLGCSKVLMLLGSVSVLVLKEYKLGIRLLRAQHVTQVDGIVIHANATSPEQVRRWYLWGQYGIYWSHTPLACSQSEN